MNYLIVDFHRTHEPDIALAGNQRWAGLASEKDAMPLLRYFLTIGAILICGLFALNAYLEPVGSDAAARVSVSPSTATLLVFAPLAKKPK